MHSLSTPPSSTLQQFLTSVLSLRGPDSLPYSEDVKYLIRQHLLSLSQSHPSLRPTTDTFTHNDGRSVNLLQSDGTLPMTYQNDTYNIPIIIWLMETYPRHPPLVYVNPTRDMVIKHQHLFVNPSGMVLIPYLQNWVFPSSNLVDLGRNLISCFIDLGRSNPNPSSNLNANAFGSGSFEDQAKHRKLRSILNKLTLENFEKLFDQVKQVNIDNAYTLSGLVGQIFDRVLMEPTFVEMYANFCSRLSVELPDFVEDDKMITFKKLLINKCQVEFERGEREEENGEIKQSEEEQEEKRRRKLVNIRLIGELYKKRMLTERIMHEGIKKLLGFNQNTTPDEENIEVLCKLMSIIGEMIDHVKAKKYMDEYFDMMFKLSNNTNLSSRVRFMLKDAIDLRKNKWQQRRKVEGPKKIEGIRRDVHQERQAQSSRLARGPNSNSSLRRGGQPMDFGPRGSASVLPSNPQIGGGYRGLPQQNRGFGNQDSIFDSFENRILSVPVRPTGDETITLGPQGGLARGMAVRGQPSMQGVAGPNNGYGSRDDMVSRNMPERPSPRPVYDRVPPSQPDHTWVSTLPQSGSSDKPAVSEDRLHEMSIEAIKEFYSARDEKEVALCIKDLNAPGFYPTMISIWVTDSFERKDMDRDSLAKLLINLTKSQENIITQESLVRGFESVLSTLEDALNNAPKAAEFLGRMFARLLTEDVIPFKQVSRIIHKGGEEEGQLVEAGLAAEVLGVILEIIKSEKGDPFLNDLCASSDIRLESFRPSTLKKTSRLDKFI